MNTRYTKGESGEKNRHAQKQITLRRFFFFFPISLFNILQRSVFKSLWKEPARLENPSIKLQNTSQSETEHDSKAAGPPARLLPPGI